jgi:hypothetical protein
MGRVRPLALVATVGSLTFLEACAGWQKPRTTANGTPILSTEHPVRVTLASGAVIVMANPRLVGDSLVGDVGTPASRMAVGMNEVKQLQERGVSGTKTGIGCGAAAGIAALVVAALMGIVAMLSDFQ